MSDDGMWMKMVQDVSEDRDRQARRADEIMWGILAGGQGHQIFGKPIRVTVEWPEGLPTGMGFKTTEDVRAFAVEQLAKLRGEQP
jgi:hypothetical protein